LTQGNFTGSFNLLSHLTKISQKKFQSLFGEFILKNNIPRLIPRGVMFNRYDHFCVIGRKILKITSKLHQVPLSFSDKMDPKHD